MAEMIPSVSVKRKLSPRGLPIAATRWPTVSASLRPNSAAGSPVASIFSTAISLIPSAPMSFASYSVSSESVTTARSQPSTTWVFVRISPSEERITPLPQL